jgi:hypothetical protein
MAGAGKSSRKYGRMKRKGGWAFDGGPMRMARRKARNHGCGNVGAHNAEKGKRVRH